MKRLGPICALTLSGAAGLWGLWKTELSDLEFFIVSAIAAVAFAASLFWFAYVTMFSKDDSIWGQSEEQKTAEAEDETPVEVQSVSDDDEEVDPSLDRARYIATKQWEVIRVPMFLGRDDCRALVVIRSLDKSQSFALDILSSHQHYSDFFALSEGEVIKFVCEDTYFETSQFSSTVAGDYLRVYRPIRSTHENDAGDEVTADDSFDISGEQPVQETDNLLTGPSGARSDYYDD